MSREAPNQSNKSENYQSVSFIADRMLGKLAKWMRIAGYDVVYQKDSTRQNLIETANRDGRIILTRDTHISYKNLIFIESEILQEQLKQVFKTFGFPSVKFAFSRCIECNSALKEIDKEIVRGKVPPYVYQVHEKFSVCPSCGKIFWEGSHYKRMMKILGEFKISKL